ncbi:hypothetical protein [Paraburkholderia bryophila]|uniref:Uncharacterized protein n=1 Tax=Paraburkholderia bryophila TaxID=420952 RepID=A0A329C894_9BURK|nr:hypothetical protein [Paraburkholderia bryophila]RAS27804.1 hypothetical protein BX591_11211 [Paraburkholderia bryophila]
MGNRPLIQHTVCIDLPGEPVECWAETDLTVLLRKHRDVIFDIQVKKGATYTVEATEDWIYDVAKKKRVKQGQFQDGQRYHIWVSRDFKGYLLLKLNGVILQRYSMAGLNLVEGNSDPKAKPAPIILTLASHPSAAVGHSTSTQFATSQTAGSMFGQSAPLICSSTNPNGVDGTWWNPLLPLKLTPPSSPTQPSANPPAAARGHAEEETVVHVFEVELSTAPAEVWNALGSGGEDTAIDTNKVATRNWLIGQLAGGTAFAKDNFGELRDLWNRSFRLIKMTHPKAGVKTYVAFKGNSALRKVITGTRYGAKSSKILAITAGTGTLESATAASWEATKGAFKKAGGLALVFTIVLDTAEWYHDYEQRGPDGRPTKDFFDLFTKIGVDLVAAGLTAAVATAVVGLATTALLVTGAIATAPVWAIAAATVGLTIVIGYFVNMADNEFHITKRLAGALRSAANYLEEHYPKDYDGYPMMFVP